MKVTGFCSIFVIECYMEMTIGAIIVRLDSSDILSLPEGSISKVDTSYHREGNKVADDMSKL
ncbi:hypothetical protein F3Y22_tig00113337pilonHSYRG00136 [Hibiscus syriacus]|uniref:Uncharacterized protein n=1 Tax=Hibiscus syriacus TaxID=106335 RepID=A0A6A2XKC9_HIBSY|nr:hypothetical protein F3Y22_tig00113337pilonHSYRG00136 [Hibiscus syriacus]